MSKIGIFTGIFDPISEHELKEALVWLRKEHLSYVIFEVEGEATLSKGERIKLVKRAISPYRKLKLDYRKKVDDVVYTKKASNCNEEEIRQGSYYLCDKRTRRELLLNGYYFESAVEFHCNKHRYEHSLAVRDVCVDLAKTHGLDTYIARTMGMLHDITKNKSDEWGKSLLDIYEPTITTMSPKVWHSETAIFFLKKKWDYMIKKY